VRVERGDGPPELLPITVSRESSWAATLDFDPDTITSVAIVDSQGRVWCSADLGMPV